VFPFVAPIALPVPRPITSIPANSDNVTGTAVGGSVASLY